MKTLLQSSTMESVYAALTKRAFEVYANARQEASQNRAIVALAGPPGSGKSTIAAEVVRRMNGTSSRPFAAVLPMDGFHLPRSTLDKLPSRQEAYAKRGAAWTFDASGVLNLVKTLHETRTHRTRPAMKAPGFDHAEKDPVEEAYCIPGHFTFIILEGNWLLYDKEPWRQISTLVDDAWFVDVEPGLARERVARRHLEAGIEQTWEAAVLRAEQNDLRNGEEVRKNLVNVGMTVYSVEEAVVGISERGVPEGSRSTLVPGASEVSHAGAVGVCT